MMRHIAVALVTPALMSYWMLATASAQGTQANTQNAQAGSNNNQGPGLTSDIRDPVVLLRTIRQKREQAETPDYSLFRTSPLTPLREWAIGREKRIYQATDIKLGTTFTTLLQGLGDAIPGEDTYGMATGMSSVGTWDGCNKGEPKQGELTFELQGRWDWGTTVHQRTRSTSAWEVSVLLPINSRRALQLFW